MAIGEVSDTGAARAEEQEPAYEGTLGRTRLRSVHVTLPSGFVRLIQVYDRLNVSTDPQLRESAISGALHRFETGEALVMPFVYHDPGARKLALVVPELLRHDELALRSKLLAELADDRESPIPAYVAEATVVVGLSALGKYLESKHSRAARGELEKREKALEVREAELARREDAAKEAAIAVKDERKNVDARGEALEQREGRLHGRAEQVTRREDELRLYSEELDAARADLAMREQELESRMEMLQQREEELATRSATEAIPAPKDSALLGDNDVVQLAPAEDMDELLDDEDVEELEPLETSPGEIVAELADAVEMVDEPLDPISDVEEIVDDVEEIVDDIDDLEVVEVEDITGLHAIPADEREGRISESNTQVSAAKARVSEPPSPPEPPPGPTPSVAPPAGFAARRASAVATLHEGTVRIFAKLPQGKEDALEEGATHDLLAQLVVVEECPVVLLTVVERAGESRPTVLRAAVDPRSDDGREMLETLRRGFRARVVLFTASGTYLRAVDASAPREGNAQRINERVAKMRAAAAVDVATALPRVLSAPPPIAAENHPFAPEAERKEARNVTEAKGALDALEKWSDHERMDHAVLVLSIPVDQVEGSIKQILEGAVSYGLPLPGRLRKRALGLGVADDAAALVARQIEAFSKTTKPKDRGGLDAEGAAAGWEALLEAAGEAEVAIDTTTHELAWKLIRAVRGGNAADIDPAKLSDMGIPELVMLLEHPRYRCDAAIEIASRKEADLAERLCKAVRKMPRNEVVRVVPRIVDLGDDAGDAFIDGLSARKTFVRQAFALSLGQLKLRRAVVPLLHLLVSEESEVWREVARVLGAFGTASVRTVTRQLKDPKGPKERYVMTLAHLLNHGCKKQVDKLVADDRPSVATMAVESLTLRQQAKITDDRACGKMALDKKDAILEFSRRFYAELEGRSGRDELAD